jgi:4-amino-4-deoxy-L-arabinose transferase-like glycosyltransferase
MHAKRNLTLVLIGAALVLAGLGHYYLLYQDIYFRDAAVFYVAAAALMLVAFRRSEGVPERGRALARSALRRLGIAVQGVFFRRPNRWLVGALTAANGLAALIALLAPALASPLLASLVALLWSGGVVAWVLLFVWPSRLVEGKAPAWLIELRGEVIRRGVTVPRVLLVAGLGSAFLGQFYFFYQREYEYHLRNGVFFWCVAIVLLALLMWMERFALTRRKAASGPSRSSSLVASEKPRSPGAGGKSVPVTRRAVPVTGKPEMEQKSAMLPPWALAVGLLLVVLSQYVLTYHPGAVVVGVVGHMVALVLVLGSLIRPSRKVALVRAPWTLILVALATGFVAWAAYEAHIRPPLERDYRQAAVSWMIGVALAVATLSGCRARWTASRIRWREVAFVALAVVVALALRVVGLAQFPDVMSGDEGSFAMEARRIMQGDLLNPFGTGWFANTTGYFYLQAVSLRLLGWNLFALRFPSALLGALGVAAVYLLARDTFGRETAWISALFLAGWTFPLHFSRLGFSNGADPFFAAMALAFLQRGLVRGRRGDFVVAGLVLGASLYSYIGTRLLLIVVMVVLLLAGAKRLRRHWRGLLIFAVVVLLVSGPLLVYFLQWPDKLFERHQFVGLFQSGQLEAEQQATGQSTLVLLLKHLGPAASVFIYTRDEGYFYRPAIPMLYVFSGALFVLGTGLAIWRWREVRYQAIMAWIGLTVLFAGWLLVLPPHQDRYLVAAPAVCLLVGRAAVVVLRRVSRLWGWRPAMRRGLVILLAVALMIVNAGYYFIVYRATGAFNWDRNTMIADRTARLMVELGPGYTTYFFGSSYMPLSGFNSARFLAPEADWVELLEPPLDWSFVKGGRGALFVVIPERGQDLPLVRERFPGGQEWQVEAPDGSLLFTAYRVESVDEPV